jgi:hypothetical protein
MRRNSGPKLLRQRLGRSLRSFGTNYAAGVLALSAASALLVAASPRRASANILKDIGAFFGKPLGGFIEAATTPTFQSAEASVHSVMADVDARAANRIRQVTAGGQSLISAGSSAAEERILQLNQSTKDRLAQADGIMAARIAQVDSSADARIAQALGGLRQVEREAIFGARTVVKDLDQAAQARITHTNDAVAARIAQVDGTVRSSIAEADADLKARIDQVDGVAERSLGSADLISTKLALNIQVTLLKVGALLGMVAFLVFALRHLYASHIPERSRLLRDERPDWSRRRRNASMVASSLGVVGIHLVAGAVGVAVFGLLAYWLPVGAKRQVAELTKVHEVALNDSYAALDFTQVRYHSAQLRLLDPGHELAHRALERKAELVRTAFMRPGLLTSPEGIRSLSQALVQAEQAHEAAEAARDSAASKKQAQARVEAEQALAKHAKAGRESAGTHASPDVLTVACYVGWQLAQNRSDELNAVTLCARGLLVHESLAPIRKIDGGAEDERFLLSPLAVHYLKAYLARQPADYPERAPYPLSTLQRLSESGPDASTFSPFASVVKYDELALILDRDSTEAYIALLDAHVTLKTAAFALDKKSKLPLLAANEKAANDKLSEAQKAVIAAKKQRLEASQRVIQAWEKFDAALDSSPELAGTALTLAALTLNDAPLSEALWFSQHPDDLNTAPRLKDEKSPSARLGMAPIRIAWARRYLKTVSTDVQELVGHKESERFLNGEEAAFAFETAYVQYRLAVVQNAAERGQLRDAAATAAARLGVYARAGNTQEPMGKSMLKTEGIPEPGKGTAEAVAKEYDGVRLRLL